MRWTRIVIAVATCAALGATAWGGEPYRIAATPMEVLASLDPEAGEFPEGIAVDRLGAFYVSLAPQGRIVRVDAEGARSVVARFESAPDALGVLGLALDPQGRLHAAVASGLPETHGLWRIGRDGSAERLPGSERMFLPNAVAFGADGTLYATESSGPPAGEGFEGGAVWRVRGDGPAEVWLRHEALTGTRDPRVGAPTPLGANGIVVVGDAVLVANTEKKHIVRIPIEADGAPGPVEVVAAFDGEFAFLDGLAADDAGDLYTVQPGTNTLVRIDADSGAARVVATGEAGLHYPTSLVVVGGRPWNAAVYVTSFAVAGSGAGPGVVRVPIGSRGP